MKYEADTAIQVLKVGLLLIAAALWFFVTSM